MNLPGVCQGCRLPVVWNGKRWRNPRQRSGAHACQPDGYVLCGALMPQVHERCARKLGHYDAHRSRYAMDNAARCRRKWYGTGTGYPAP